MRIRQLFDGRLNRRNFLLSEIALWMVAVLVDAYRQRPASLDSVAGVAFLFFVLLVVFVAASLSVRRLHDIGRSGWLFLFTYLPIANVVLAIYTLVKKGDTVINKYGPPPQPRISLRDVAGMEQKPAKGSAASACPLTAYSKITRPPPENL